MVSWSERGGKASGLSANNWDRPNIRGGGRPKTDARVAEGRGFDSPGYTYLFFHSRWSPHETEQLLCMEDDLITNR